jgi:hypothetical protein
VKSTLVAVAIARVCSASRRVPLQSLARVCRCDALCCVVRLCRASGRRSRVNDVVRARAWRAVRPCGMHVLISVAAMRPCGVCLPGRYLCPCVLAHMGEWVTNIPNTISFLHRIMGIQLHTGAYPPWPTIPKLPDRRTSLINELSGTL